MSFRTTLLIGAAALCAVILPAAAQDYSDVSYGPSEEVVVHAPRYTNERSAIGAPIRDVALSGEVAYDDLDLTRDHDVRVLHRRIREAARDLCSKLNVRYPVATSDSPPCYRTAYDDAMEQADAAIERARNGE
jgi:UrcA family protein